MPALGGRVQRLAHLKQTRPETVKVDFTSTKRSEGKGNAKEARSGLCTLDPVHLDGADYAFPPPPSPSGSEYIINRVPSTATWEDTHGRWSSKIAAKVIVCRRWSKERRRRPERTASETQKAKQDKQQDADDELVTKARQ